MTAPRVYVVSDYMPYEGEDVLSVHSTEASVREAYPELRDAVTDRVDGSLSVQLRDGCQRGAYLYVLDCK